MLLLLSYDVKKLKDFRTTWTISCTVWHWSIILLFFFLIISFLLIVIVILLWISQVIFTSLVLAYLRYRWGEHSDVNSWTYLIWFIYRSDDKKAKVFDDKYNHWYIQLVLVLDLLVENNCVRNCFLASNRCLEWMVPVCDI